MADTTAYQKAGVDVEAGYQSTQLMKEDIKRTMTELVLSKIGGFGALVALPKGLEEPVLVSGTDGVGTKLMIAIKTGILHTVGIDAVAMCVNDILCQGASPLFFLDYIACGKNVPEKIAELVKGVSEGCVQSECALVGGETAEMPGMYQVGDYDIAGFAVGAADRKNLITGEKIQPGNVLIGLSSSGVHSNGFSLIRRLVEEAELSYEDFIEELGMRLGEALLEPTRIYVKAFKGLLDTGKILGLCHITGGGFYENIPRMLPEGIGAVIDARAIPKIPVFSFLKKLSGLSEEALFSTFNMGVGMVACVKAEDAQEMIETINERGYHAFIIGQTVASDDAIVLEF